VLRVACVQGLLAKLSQESAASSAALLAGHDDCSRLQEHTALLSKQFSRAAMQVRVVLRRLAWRARCFHRSTMKPEPAATAPAGCGRPA
jgi:hypothetical protein